MELNGYKKRLIDKKVQEYLNTFGAVAIEDLNGVEKHGRL